jgi:hypothetical protein
MVCDSLRGSKIVVSNASVYIFAPSAGLFAIIPELSGTVFLTILYPNTATTAQEPSFAGSPSLSIGDITLPASDSWRFCLSGANCSQSVFRAVRSIFTVVPESGRYSIIAEGAERGFLGPSDEDNGFEISSTSSFVTKAGFESILPTLTPPTTAWPTFLDSPSSPFTARIDRVWRRRSVLRGSFGFLFWSHRPI